MAAALEDVLVRHQVALQRLSAAEVQKVDKFISQISVELNRRLSGQDLTTLSQSRLERAIDRLNDYLGDTLGQYRAAIMSDLLNVADHEAQYSTTALNNAVPVNVNVDFVSPTALQIQTAALQSPLLVKGADGGKLLKSFLSDWTAVQKSRISNAIRMGVATGQTNASIAQSIRGTAALKYTDGILALTKSSADKVVHTAVQHVANSVRQAVFDANDDIISGVRWVATLDSRTCIQCASLDLVEFPSGSGPRPPIHIFCRCVTVPTFKGALAKLNGGGKRPSVGSDGAQIVSANTGYYGWLQSQPAKFQDFAIGPSRAALLRNGGLSSSRFAQMNLDKRFIPLSLQEMKRVEPSAFEDAGVDV